MAMRVVIAGSSGFLGAHLSDALVKHGHEVTPLVRRHTTAAHESSWNPYRGEIDRSVIERADVVVNLAGSPTMGNPHSRRWARALRESRVTTTRVLAEAIEASDRTPAFLAQNAVGFYGDHGSDPVTEASGSLGESLMTSVCADWQEAARPAVDAGARVCFLRTAPVLDRRSAPLKQLRLLFRTGLGARLGPGRQYFPVVSLRDWVRAVVHLAEHESASGPFNICSARTPTNAEFTRALASALNRPAVAFVPAPLIRLGAGPLAPELLGSLDVRPAALLASGHEPLDEDVAAVLDAGLHADE